MRKKPTAVAVVDFEHWFISCDNQFGIKPDIKKWADEIRAEYDVKEIAFFADFTNPSLRAELDKIRNISATVFDTQNPSERIKKDFTDFIMLDYIYQKAMSDKKIDTYIIFTGDGHFSSVVRFIINKCHKKVCIYGVVNCTSSMLKMSATNCIEIPTAKELQNEFCGPIITWLDHVEVHKNHEEDAVKDVVIQKAALYGKVSQKGIRYELEQMIKDGYLYEETIRVSKKKSVQVIKARWQKIVNDGLKI